MKINNFRGDLTDISAKIESLFKNQSSICQNINPALLFKNRMIEVLASLSLNLYDGNSGGRKWFLKFWIYLMIFLLSKIRDEDEDSYTASRFKKHEGWCELAENLSGTLFLEKTYQP